MASKMKEPQRAAAEVNTFTAGLNTDAVPNNYPENAVKDILNIELQRNGSNRRRLGIDYEDSYVDVSTTQSSADSLSFNTYKWENAGGDADKSLLIIQCGKQFNVFDLDTSPISNGSIYSREFTSMVNTDRITFSQADDYLVAVNGDGLVYTYEYDSGTVTETSDRILVRDFWGVEDYDGSDDLREAGNVAIRPTTLTDNHLYNLRNQSWGVERVAGDRVSNEAVQDPIYRYRQFDTTHYPSNADMVNYAFYPESANGSNPVVDRFWGKDLYKNKIGSYEAARGHFIIDILDRGASRLEAEALARSNNPTLTNYNITLNDDSTAGGAKVVAQFGGRVFYAGFGGALTDGDEKSPNLSSYIAFSKLVKDKSDITQCYQLADPTSVHDPEIVATDGGYVRIDGAYNIQGMVATGSSLVIIAQNGVWRLIGGSDYGFAADNYLVEQLSSEGCRAQSSIMYADARVLFWGDNGIYDVGPDQFGDWKVMNITKDRIQQLYNAIEIEDKATVQGLYDEYDRKCRWVYNNRIGSTNETRELVLDIDLNAFYLHELPSVSGGLPKAVAIAESNPFTAGDVSSDVEVNAVQVTVNAADVTVTEGVRSGLKRTLIYVTLTQLTPTIEYTFSTYVNGDFTDWVTYDATGVDAAAYFVTGEFPVQDYQRRKQISKLTVHMNRTEDGVVIDGTGAYQPDNQSSCKVQARWNWANGSNANKWSTARQYYRYPRHWIPEDINDNFDTGFETIVSKDIIRGSGRALSLKFSTDPLKDFQVNGWSMVWEVGDSEGG